MSTTFLTADGESLEILSREEAGYAEIPGMTSPDNLAPVCLIATCGQLSHGGYGWENFCTRHREITLCPRCRILHATEPGAMCANCKYLENNAPRSTGSLVLSHLWNSSYREATCSAVPCKPMQHLPNPTFDFTVD